MPSKTNVTIKVAKQNKRGEGQHGVWIKWGILFEEEDHWYNYFQSGKKVEPYKGMEIAYLEWEHNEQYNSDEITLIKPHVSEEPKANNGYKPNGNAKNPISMYVAYVKDIQVARINKMTAKQIDTYTLSELCKEIPDVAMTIWRMTEEPKEEYPQPDRAEIVREMVQDAFPPLEKNEQPPHPADDKQLNIDAHAGAAHKK